LRARAASQAAPVPTPDANLFNEKADGTAWRTKPSWYIVANRDRTVQPDLERFLSTALSGPGRCVMSRSR
jgi:hypothetical protein